MQQHIVEYILVSQIVEELVEAFKVFSEHSGGGRKILKRTVQRKKPVIQEKINQMTMNVEISQIHYIDKVVDVLGVMQKQVPAIQKVQKTVEVPQVQHHRQGCGSACGVAETGPHDSESAEGCRGSTGAVH